MGKKSDKDKGSYIMRVIQVRARKKGMCVALIINLLAVLSGCSSLEPADQVIVIEQEQEESLYELAVVSIGDVEKTIKVKCIYQQERDMDLSFSISGKQISRVYVKEGEHVAKGQLLAELSGGDLEERIRKLEYQIARNNLLLEQALESENYEISTCWLQFLYQSGQTEAEKERLEDKVVNIQKSYRYKREDYQDAIELDETQLAQLRTEIQQSRIYAPMAGSVSWMKERLEGATSARGEKIMTIIDSSHCYFVVEQAEYAKYFEAGIEVDMTIVSGTGAGQYKVVPYKIDQWGDRLMFTPSESGADSVIEVGATGTISVAQESRKQVTKIPLKALHKADGKTYVYVVGDDNLRQMKWIEVGLYGDDSVEVISGVSEGEKVILK